VVTFTRGTATVSKTVTGTGAATAVVLTAGDVTTLGQGTVNVSAIATDAAGNASTAGTSSFTLDTVAPTLSATAPTISFGPAVVGTPGNSAGETITLSLNFDGPVSGLTSGTNNTVFTVGIAVVNATWGGVEGSTTRTLTYTIAAGQNGQATISEAALKTALEAGIKDAAGNAFTYTANGGNIANIDSTALPVIDTVVPILRTNLSNVTNLDVASDLVLTSATPLKVGSGFIRINDLTPSGGGFRNDVNDNDQLIDVSTAVAQGFLSFSADQKTVIINPKWDLDLSSSYSLSIDAGAFQSVGNNSDSSALTAVTFGTVTPGFNDNTPSARSDARPSQIMTSSGDLQVDNRWWYDLQGINTDDDDMVQLGDLSDKSYVLVSKNYATTPAVLDIVDGNGTTGIVMAPANVGMTNFGKDDQLYFDSQVNNTSIQSFLSIMTQPSDRPGTSAFPGIIEGQNNWSWDVQLDQSSAESFTAMTFEGDPGTTDWYYWYESDARSLPDLIPPDLRGVTFLPGWANAQPVVMG
jgi:hypothetical protein